jgi:hypothetical protein
MFTPGIAFLFSPDTLFAVDVSWTDGRDVPPDERIHFRGGLEHWILDRRFGFRTGYISYSNLPGLISIGTSYQGKNWDLDYAYLSHPKHLGNSHRVSAGWKFGAEGGLEDVRYRPTLLESLVGDERIHLRWNPPEGVKVEGYRIYLKAEKENEFRRVKPTLLMSNYCLLRGAQNGILYRAYITAVVDGNEGPPSGELAVTPRPMSAEARHYYDLGVDQLNTNKLSASLYSARKAEELDPNNYEINDLIRKLEEAMKKGLVQPGVKP